MQRLLGSLQNGQTAQRTLVHCTYQHVLCVYYALDHGAAVDAERLSGRQVRHQRLRPPLRAELLNLLKSIGKSEALFVKPWNWPCPRRHATAVSDLARAFNTTSGTVNLLYSSSSHAIALVRCWIQKKARTIAIINKITCVGPRCPAIDECSSTSSPQN